MLDACAEALQLARTDDIGETKPHYPTLQALPKAGTKASLSRGPLWRHDLRQEPYAVSKAARADLCRGIG